MVGRVVCADAETVPKGKNLSAYEEAAAESHPLRKKPLKKDAKKATRIQWRSGQSVGMEVDELRDMFMTGIDDRRVPCISNTVPFFPLWTQPYR